jgi:hypothetical protein
MSTKSVRHARAGLRRSAIVTVSGALMAAMALALAVPPPSAVGASSQGGSPVEDQGSSAHYRSNITAVSPRTPGLSVQVLEFADRLLLTNHTGKTVTVYGYRNEPYARVLADGTAEQNVRSPATYLNQSFYGEGSVPSVADPNAAPRWQVVDRTGVFEWHDHRIHYTSPLLPPQVRDQSRRTLIFNWQVPIQVGARRGNIDGQLFWEPNSSSAPIAATVVGVVIVLGGLALMLFVRRRRARTLGGEQDGEGGAPDRAAKEAW